MHRKNNNKNAIAVTATVIMLIVVSITVAVFLNIKDFGTSNTKRIIPTINCTVTSVTTGSENPVTIDFSLEIDPSVKQNTGVYELRDQIKSVLETLDYEKLSGENNIKYIKDNVTADLEKFLNAEGVVQVFITDIQYGSVAAENGGDKVSESSRSKAFGNIFQKKEEKK